MSIPIHKYIERDEKPSDSPKFPNREQKTTEGDEYFTMLKTAYRRADLSLFLHGVQFALILGIFIILLKGGIK